MKQKRMTKIVSWILVLSMVLCDLPANVVRAAAAVDHISILNASDMENASLTADVKQGDFVIKASSTSAVTVDGSVQTSTDHRSFTKRIKLNGTGKTDARAIEFTTTGAAVITVYSLSGSDSANRKLGIYDKASDSLEPVTTLDSFGLNTIKANDGDKKIPAVTAKVEKAGTYSLRSVSSGINVYYVSVNEGETEEVRFDDGIKPVVKSAGANAEDGTQLDVTVEGTIVNRKTDRIWVKLYSDAGTLIDTANLYAEDFNEMNQAIAALNPGKNGKFTIVAESCREGAETTYVSETFEVENFRLPLGKVEFKSVLTTKELGLKVDWKDTVSVDSYDIAYKVKGTEEFTTLAKGLTKSEYEITADKVTPGIVYTIKVTAYGGEDSTSAVYDKRVSNCEDRFAGGKIGSGASGEITENEDGSITLDVLQREGTEQSGGKLADSEDGFLYYYTEIDPVKENFTLKATFHVDESENKDNQSGFGIMAVDTLIEGNSAARYFNSAGSMVRKYTKTVDGNISSLYGAPGGYFITGYTGSATTSSASRKTIDTAPFDWNYKADYTTPTNANPPKFDDGEDYTLVLKKDNTGFHASMVNAVTGENLYDEVVCYEPELLLKQDKTKYYVGVCAARKIKITVSNMEFTTRNPAEDPEGVTRPEKEVTPVFLLDSTKKTSNESYEAAFKADFVGTIQVLDAEGKIVADKIKVDPRVDETFRPTAKLTLTQGDNTFKAIYTPAADEAQGSLLGSAETLVQTPIQFNFTVNLKKYGDSSNALYVSPSGLNTNKGTKASPLDIYTAVAYAQPGQEIILLGGTYNLKSKVVIERGSNGTKKQPITLMSDPKERAVFDLTNSSGGGLFVNADYWHVYDIEIKNSKGSSKPILISGHNNVIEKITTHDNKDTGLQISGSASEPFSFWPSNNLILSCESYNNCDPQANDADGFAAKLTCGEGNVFRYCISRNNIDDGWDLYAKSTTGNIGVVTIDQCVAYENGKLTADTGVTTLGEGNGFKLGGESMPVAHILKNSISFNNYKNGVFSNSNPSCKIYNTTSYNNAGSNLYLNTNAAATTWTLENFVSYKGANTESIGLKGQAALDSVTNYLNGANIAGNAVADNWFENLDTSVRPEIAEDGSIDMHGLLTLTGNAAAGVGGVISANPNPTVIEIGVEIGETPVTSQAPVVSTVPSETPDVTPSISAAPSVKPSASTVPSVTPSVKPSVKPSASTAPSKPVIKTDLASGSGNTIKTYTYNKNQKAAILKVKATGTKLTYQWYRSRNNSYTGASAIKGAEKSSYSPSTKSTGTWYYFVKVTGVSGSNNKTTTVKSKRVKVVVKQPVTSLKVTSTKVTLKAGSSKKLSVKVLPVSATNKKLTYKSSNTKYAAVSSTGVVKTKKTGKGKTVTITVTSKDNTKLKKKITVKIK